MSKKEKNAERKRKQRHSLINLIGAFLLLVAAGFLGLLIFRKSPPLLEAYQVYLDHILEFESYILGLRNTGLILFTVLLLYAIKAWVPIFPVSVMCFITGVILPMYLSFAVNIAGLMLLLSLKYWWGRHMNGGALTRLLGLQPAVRTFLERDSRSRPWLLFVFRVVPSFPVNTVSQIYGAMNFDFVDYLLISLLGCFPKLVMYIIVGNHFFDPLSVPFLTPLIVILVFSGVTVITINQILAQRETEAQIKTHKK